MDSQSICLENDLATKKSNKRRYRRKSVAIPTNGFKSRLESRIWSQLPTKKKDYKFSYETDKLDYVMRKTYIPDIVVVKPDGTKMYIEIKGWFRPEDRTKMVAAKAFNPDVDIRIVFADDSKISKNSSTRYSQWCKKNGFPYAIGHIPKEWF
jgi:predicted nuclease of restriction endonuclease-like RecB superfamily